MNLLLEIGAEEIPDSMLAGAQDYLGNAISTLLTQNQLLPTNHQLPTDQRTLLSRDPASPLGVLAREGAVLNLRTDATPRRLVVRAEGLTSRQPDTEERVWGPAKT